MGQWLTLMACEIARPDAFCREKPHTFCSKKPDTFCSIRTHSIANNNVRNSEAWASLAKALKVIEVAGLLASLLGHFLDDT